MSAVPRLASSSSPIRLNSSHLSRSIWTLYKYVCLRACVIFRWDGGADTFPFFFIGTWSLCVKLLPRYYDDSLLASMSRTCIVGGFNIKWEIHNSLSGYTDLRTRYPFADPCCFTVVQFEPLFVFFIDWNCLLACLSDACALYGSG